MPWCFHSLQSSNKYLTDNELNMAPLMDDTSSIHSGLDPESSVFLDSRFRGNDDLYLK